MLAGRPTTLIFLDIDNFKAFNDRYSYDVGDQVLVEIAVRLQESVSVLGITCRYGGEEFLAFLPGTDLAGAAALAETLRRGVAASPIATDAGALSVTISLGVAVWQPGANTAPPEDAVDVLNDLIARAGRMLHDAKEGGRNRVVAETEHAGSRVG